jgi:hypothetical protein
LSNDGDFVVLENRPAPHGVQRAMPGVSEYLAIEHEEHPRAPNWLECCPRAQSLQVAVPGFLAEVPGLH